MEVKLYYEMLVFDREGKLVRKTRRRRCRSFVKQYAQILRHKFNRGNTELTVKDVGGTDRTLKAAGTANDFDINRSAGYADFGPVVGTGSTAVTISDYALETLIAQGTGAGQLDYQATAFGSISVADSTCTFTVSRIMVNDSGGAITVNEVGIYAYAMDSGDSGRYFLIVRDIVSGGQEVPDGGSVKLQYTFSITA